MSQKDYTIRIAFASLLVIAMALPIGLFTLQESTRLDSRATSRQTIEPGSRVPGELLVSPALTQQKSGFNNCRVGGCNGELCTDPATGPLESICVYKEEFVCYRDAICEMQADGQCGWTLTDELRTCLGKNADNPIQPPINPTTPPRTPPPAEPTNLLPYYTPTPIPKATNILPYLSPTPDPIEPKACNLICPDTFTLTSDCQCLPPEPSEQLMMPGAITPPSLSTQNLPQAVRNQYYLGQFELSSPLENSQLAVTVDGLPSNLYLESCTRTTTSFGLRISRCTISGIVTGPNRTYRLTFTLTDGLDNIAIETRDFQVISQQSWLDRLLSLLGFFPR